MSDVTHGPRIIDIGQKVWAVEEGTDKRVTIDGYPVGGIVTDIYTSVTEDGEIIRKYKTLLHVGTQAPKVSVIPEWQIGVVEPAYGPDKHKMIRRLCHEIAKPLILGKRDLTLGQRDYQRLADVMRLFQATTPGGSK